MGARWRCRIEVLVVLAVCGAIPARAQPTFDPVGMRSQGVAQPLPVLDDQGKVIPEDLIRATVHDGGFRDFLNPVLGALFGILVFSSSTQPGHDCSIYDPCTPQEHRYKDLGAFVGMVVGALVGSAFPNGSVDRPEAVRRLRATRSTEAATPP